MWYDRNLHQFFLALALLCLLVTKSHLLCHSGFMSCNHCGVIFSIKNIIYLKNILKVSSRFVVQEDEEDLHFLNHLQFVLWNSILLSSRSFSFFAWWKLGNLAMPFFYQFDVSGKSSVVKDAWCECILGPAWVWANDDSSAGVIWEIDGSIWQKIRDYFFPWKTIEGKNYRRTSVIWATLKFITYLPCFW